jgi:hypothetical protein
MPRRRIVAAAVVLGLFVLLAPRIGERHGSEAHAISSIRAIVSAELAFASMNSGRYGLLECLADRSCRPSTVSQPWLLESRLAAAADRNGYRFEFHPYPDALRLEPSPRVRLTRFAVVAVSLDAGNKGFCGDDRQVIYVTNDRVAPRVDGGRCLDTRTPLR